MAVAEQGGVGPFAPRAAGRRRLGRAGRLVQNGRFMVRPQPPTERQGDATQRRRLGSTVKQSRLLPVTLAQAALVPAL